MSEKLLIKPEESDRKLQFLNSIYYKPFYDKEAKEVTGEDINDFLVIVYRNEETDEKKLKIMANPSIQYFVANDDVEIEQAHLNQIELDKVHIEKVQYKHLLRRLCELQNEQEGTNYDFDNYIGKNKFGKWNGKVNYDANQFHLYNRVFASDIDIEDYYKGRFLDTYTKASRSKLTKSYTDIEVDSIDIAGFPNEEEALCPVNALTVFFDENMTFYTLLLNNEENEQIPEFKRNIKKFKKKLKKEFGDEFEYRIKFFDDEEELIIFYFQLINTFKPDFDLI